MNDSSQPVESTSLNFRVDSSPSFDSDSPISARKKQETNSMSKKDTVIAYKPSKSMFCGISRWSEVLSQLLVQIKLQKAKQN